MSAKEFGEIRKKSPIGLDKSLSVWYNTFMQNNTIKIVATAPDHLAGWDYKLYNYGKKWAIRINHNDEPVGCHHFGSEKYIKKVWKKYTDRA